MLLDDLAAAKVTLRLETEVLEVAKTESGFALRLSTGPVECQSLVIACGGKSIPKMGATAFGYRVAEQFSLKVTETRPALVPLTFEPMMLERLKGLSGVSADAVASHGKTRFREALLFTHRGLSGPAILQVSSYWQANDASQPIRIDLLPGVGTRAWIEEERRSKASLAAVLAERLPKRFAQQWCEANGLDKPVVQLSDRAIEAALARLKDWPVQPSGTLGYNKAEVTLGGVDTRGLSSKTMQATAMPGLFFIGEGVDVTGHLGGFNFQWAWASAHAAGEVA